MQPGNRDPLGLLLLLLLLLLPMLLQMLLLELPLVQLIILQLQVLFEYHTRLLAHICRPLTIGWANSLRKGYCPKRKIL